MSSTVAAILWKHLFTSGHDACRLLQTDNGFTLVGHSNFEHEDTPCCLSYSVNADASWQTQDALVSGFLGDYAVRFEIEQNVSGDWTLNGEVQDGVAGQHDLDLGFTPATNLIALRRFALQVGAQTSAPAAYLLFPERRPPELKLTAMDQTYRRLDAERYDYTGTNYHEILTVSEVGFVLEYPNLWTGNCGCRVPSLVARAVSLIEACGCLPRARAYIPRIAGETQFLRAFL